MGCPHVITGKGGVGTVFIGGILSMFDISLRVVFGHECTPTWQISPVLTYCVSSTVVWVPNQHVVHRCRSSVGVSIQYRCTYHRRPGCRVCPRCSYPPLPPRGVVTVGLRGYPKTEGWVLKETTKPKASLSSPSEEHSGQVYVCSFPVFYAGKLENKNKICICIYFRATI